MSVATVKFPVILFGAAQLLKITARRHPDFKARVKERNIVAQIMARDEEIGRWYRVPRRQDHVARRPARQARHQIGVQERRDRRPTADAADQLARSDQRAEGFQAHRRGPGGSHQLVRPDLMMMQSVGWKIGMPDARRLDALLQHGQWRAALRLCQGRQDHPHDADRVRRHDPQPWTIEARGQKFTPPRKTTLAPHGQNASRSSIRPTGCSIR